MKRVAVVLATVACIGVSAPAAHATFSGRNGMVVFAAQPAGEPKALYRITPPTRHIGRFLAANPYEDRSPAWSPDGATVAFVSDRSGGLDIWSVYNGQPAVDLTATGAMRESLPTWSSDGRIAFVTLHGSGETNTTIDVMDADGSNRLTVRTPDRPVFGLEWSPVADRIVYAVPDGAAVDIYSMRSDGSQRVRLADDLPHAVIYDWSPDGRWIVFQGGSGPGTGLFAVASGGTHPIRRLTTSSSAGADGHASYSPNGLKILFVRDQGGGDEFWLMRADGTHERRLRKLHRFSVYGVSWQAL